MAKLWWALLDLKQRPIDYEVTANHSMLSRLISFRDVSCVRNAVFRCSRPTWWRFVSPRLAAIAVQIAVINGSAWLPNWRRTKRLMCPPFGSRDHNSRHHLHNWLTRAGGKLKRFSEARRPAGSTSKTATLPTTGRQWLSTTTRSHCLHPGFVAARPD